MHSHQLVVLLSTFLAFVMFGGYFYGTSRLLPAVTDTFGSTRAEAGTIQSLNTAVFSLSSGISGAVVLKFGSRSVGIVAGLMSALAVGLCFFATSILYIIIVQAVFEGLGCSLLNICCNTAVTAHFQGKHRLMALSIMICGGGVGGMGFSFLIQLLLDEYGLRGTYLVVGGMFLNMACLALLWTNRNTFTKSTVPSQISQMSSNQHENNASDLSDRKISIMSSIKELLGTKAFPVFAIGAAFCHAAQISALLYLADMVLDKHTSSSVAVLAVFLFNLLGVLGRLIPGIVNQLPFSIERIIPIAISITGITGNALIASVNMEWVTLAACSLVGVTFGMMSSYISVETVQLVGKKNMPIGIGFVFTLAGIMSLMAGPALGYARDTTGSYTVVYSATCVISVIAGALLVTSMLIKIRGQ